LDSSPDKEGENPGRKNPSLRGKGLLGIGLLPPWSERSSAQGPKEKDCFLLRKEGDHATQNLWGVSQGGGGGENQEGKRKHVCQRGKRTGE